MQICPYCGETVLIPMAMKYTVSGGVPVLVLSCVSCKKVLGTVNA